ncbi:hypothetical protein J3R83DRAFT_12286 [Lanmaoa asiatica]|nr:hypothetical protein J3R83DRAFT_12286 [Lanmaoa asiatica]
MVDDDYTALSQGGDDEVEKERLLSLSDGYTQDTSVQVPPIRRRAIPSQWIGVAVIVLLLINASCLLVTMQQLRLASRVLRQHLNYADNRDLPRPDPYDGL